MSGRERAICVLGCRPGSAALARRARAARSAFREGRASSIVTCGGRSWSGVVEADELARMLREGGVAEEAIVRERHSLDTHQNALHAARILGARGVTDVVVVTCSWHLRRAVRSFERAGLHVVGTAGATPPNATELDWLYWKAREHLAYFKDSFRRDSL